MRHHCRLSILLFALVCGGGSATAADLTGRYVWPLEGKTSITSGFCDCRTAHYHGGIDISTDGREGFPVRAADSGYVMRLSASYWSYGKAVYLKLADGRIAVYGHLSEFGPKIREYVESNQYSAKRYQQNLWPSPDEIPVSRGEIIAESGQTGAGPPHLHFEIRTGDNRPLNPLRFGFDKPDKIAPSITAVTLEPRHPGRLNVLPSRVNGSLSSQTFALTGPAKARTLAETQAVAGKVGIVIAATDVIDASKGTVSVYLCRLIVNGVLVAAIRQDSINYDDTRLINLHRAYSGRPGITERPINMFRLPGNRLWQYETLLNDGWLELGKTVLPGTNNVRIEVEDASGNMTSAEFKLVAQELLETGEQTAGVAALGATKSVEIEIGDWTRNGIVLRLNQGIESRATYFADRQLTQPLVALRGKSESPLVWLPAAEPIGDTIWVDAEDGPFPYPVGAHAVSAADGGELVSEDGNALVRFSPGDLYESAYFRFDRETIPSQSRATASAAYRLTPADIPFDHSAKLSIQYAGAAHPERLAIYRFRPDNSSWGYEGGDRDPSEDRISCDIAAPGVFALLADQTPPTIQGVQPGKGETTKSNRPTITFEMIDDLSGIGSDADVIMTIDGEWTLVEYDPDTRQAKARPREALAPGEHRAEISVKDRMGNEESFIRILRIVK